ncbi:MAG: lysylphosphatidylglycerol synthase transmembrane domain-containing protein [Bdellovibrionota bacterium]
MTKTNAAGVYRKLFLNAAKVCFTFGILYYLYQKGLLDFSRVRALLSDYPVVLTVFSVVVLTAFGGVFRWWMLLLGQGLKVSIWEALRLTMIGTFFNTAIPGAVSGDLIKGYYVVRQQSDGRGRIKALTTLLLDRLLGLSALICISFFAMISNLQAMLGSAALRPLCGFIALLWLGVMTFYLFVLVEWSFTARILKLLKKLPAGEYVSRLFEAVKSYENCRHYIIKGFFLSITVHCAIIGVFILLAKSLGGFEMIPIDKFFFLTPLGLLVTAIPVAPAGLGTGHAAFLGLFQLVGSRAGADLFTAFVAFQILMSLIGGVFYLRYRQNM